jgi:hypothetical protein
VPAEIRSQSAPSSSEPALISNGPPRVIRSVPVGTATANPAVPALAQGSSALRSGGWRRAAPADPTVSR